MTGWEPVATLDDLDQLDTAECIVGYFDGRNDAPEPQPNGNRSRAYWHGWKCGMQDAGRLEVDDINARLVAAYVKRGRLG